MFYKFQEEVFTDKDWYIFDKCVDGCGLGKGVQNPYKCYDMNIFCVYVQILSLIMLIIYAVLESCWNLN